MLRLSTSQVTMNPRIEAPPCARALLTDRERAVIFCPIGQNGGGLDFQRRGSKKVPLPFPCRRQARTARDPRSIPRSRMIEAYSEIGSISRIAQLNTLCESSLSAGSYSAWRPGWGSLVILGDC